MSIDWNSFLSVLPREAGKYALGIVFGAVIALILGIVNVAARRKLLKFFSLTGTRVNVTIYLSRMKVVKTEGLEPILKGYEGPAILNPEMVGAVSLRDLLKSVTIPMATGRLRDWVGKRFVTFAAVDPAIKVSPEPERLKGLASIAISLGSQVYNAISRRYLVDEPTHFEFTRAPSGERSILIKTGGQRGQYLVRDEPGKEIGVIQRINDTAHDRTYFICAGLGASATHGCALYLTEHWRELYDDNGVEEFALYLVFRNQPSNQDASVEPEAPVYVRRGKVPIRRPAARIPATEVRPIHRNLRRIPRHKT